MTRQKLFHISPNGGSILCLEGVTGRIFRACSANQCTYTKSLHSAKSYLDFLENNQVKLLPPVKERNDVPAQRKTTLKWNTDGTLSSVDMARILNRLQKSNLTECELSCEWNC